jgi:undecaprenyl-diphosphatase
MATKPDLRQIPSWPERQLLWIERERSFARWMHGASARPWVTPSLNVVSRLGDGWMWYAVILSLPWLDHVNGTTCAIRMFRRRRRQPADLPDHQALHRAPAAVSNLPRHPRLRALARRVQLPERPHAALGVVRADPRRVLPGARLRGLAVRRAGRGVARRLGLHYPSDVLVGAAVGAATALVSFNLL